MNLLNQWMQSDWLKALGWTFVHSLWQIAIIGLMLYIILRLIPGRSAHVRYTISTMGIWLIVISALSTFLVMLPETKQITEVTGRVILMKGNNELYLTDSVTIWLESNMPMMLTVWLGGVMILMIRLLFSLGWVSHMRSTAALSLEIQQSLDNIVHRLQLKIKPVASESNYVSSPVTIGHLKPLILFPIGIVNQLTPGEVEAILTHELAHIVRRDYLSNLIQSFIETLFYYHPVTWWISSVVREERENRADDLAVSWCGDHLGYAKALMTVEEMQIDQKPALTIGFASRKGVMLARIQRILHIPYKNHNQMEKTVLLSLCSLCFLAFTITGNTKNEDQNKKEEATQEITVSVTRTDTIPSKGTYRIHKKTDEQEINIEVEDGDIKELKIDGKEIEPADFEEYEDIIDELFGDMDTPPSMEGFNFEMPAMPPMPEMEFMPAMPPMPDMPPMPAIEIARLFGNGNFSFYNGEGEGHYQIIENTEDGHTKIIIINADGDSNIIISDKFICKDLMPKIALKEYMLEAEEWKKHGEEWKEQGEEWKKMSEEWKKNWEQNSENWKQEWHAQQEELRGQQHQLHEDAFRLHEQAEEERLRSQEGRIYKLDGLRTPGVYMTDVMIEEGLIQPGEVALIQLTPTKLKINGKKMDDDTHRRYLQMYEGQQGIELSGNSRVEFRAKTRRSM